MHSNARKTIAGKNIVPRKGTLNALARFFGSPATVFLALALMLAYPGISHAAVLGSSGDTSTSTAIGYASFPTTGTFPTFTTSGLGGSSLWAQVILAGNGSAYDSGSGQINIAISCWISGSYQVIYDTYLFADPSLAVFNSNTDFHVYQTNMPSINPTSGCDYSHPIEYTVGLTDASDLNGAHSRSNAIGNLYMVVAQNQSDLPSTSAGQSQIISFSPAVGAVGSTTVTLSATILNNSASSSYSFVNFHVTNTSCDATISDCPSSPFDVNLPISFDGVGTVSTTTTLANGLYVGYVSLQPLASNGLPVQNVMSFTSGVDPSRSLITFNTAQGTSTATTTDLTQGCSTTVIGVPLGAIACFLFVPDQTTIAQIANLPSIAATRAPFVYAFQIGAIRNAVFTASSTASTSLTVALWHLPGSMATTTITLISESEIAAVPYSGAIYDIMTFLIWLSMAEYIYYRVIRMHDTHTPS